MATGPLTDNAPGINPIVFETDRFRRRIGIARYPADGVDHTLSTLIFNRVLNAARYSSPIPTLTA